MEIPIYLAMTAGEVLKADRLPERLAWMACHFSPYGTGLSNLPQALPEGAMLMLNDRMPPDWHDPELVASTLSETAEKFQCSCIVLDFQREGAKKTAPVIEAVLKKANCPVGVSSSYAENFDCPVLLPPIPPHIPLTEYLAPWRGREIWQELAFEGTEIAVTAEGSRYTSLPRFVPSEKAHFDEELGCRYDISVEDERVIFRLGRLLEDWNELIHNAKEYKVVQGVGLWQEVR